MRARTVLLPLALAAALAAADDDFRREGDADARNRKDPLEGKPPPALQVRGWMNLDSFRKPDDPEAETLKSLDLKTLKGKVVVLKFWGVW